MPGPGQWEWRSGRGPLAAPEEPEKLTGWRRPLGWIPLRWMRQETFWRDLTVNMMASGLVVVLGYVFAIGSGLLESPGAKETLMGIWNVLITIGGFIVVSAITFWAMVFRHKPEDSRRRRIIRRGIWVLVMISILLSMTQAMTGLLNDTFWPFTTPAFHIEMAPSPR